MWKGIVLPTIVITVAWILVSCSTTYYIQWLDQSYQRVFAENVAAIQAAGRVQEAAWQTVAMVFSPEDNLRVRKSRLPEMVTALEREVHSLHELALTDAERVLANRLDDQVANYRQTLESFSSRSFEPVATGQPADAAAISRATNHLVETAQQLREINQHLVEESARKRESTNGSVLAARTSVQFVGQVLGIAYGWWMARRLHWTVARITVTLRDATDGETALGAVNVDHKQGLDALRSQVELVVARVRQVNDELQNARHEVLRSERLAAVGELAAGVAHELRNPLTSVKLLLQHAAQRGISETLSDSKLHLILDEIARMESTIQGLLDFSRPPQLHRSEYDVRETIQRAVNLVLGRAEQQNVKVSTSIGALPLLVQADAAQLNQVFVNLLINGLEAMPDGGTILVTAAHEDDCHSVSIQVHDTGPGIAEMIQKRLFEPFATTKDRGTGLGLAVSRRIVDQHHGTIFAENDVQGGAIFRVSLPAI
ncbi:MAG: signal transduction histidine kinase, nitrogen specific, NtrB [Planctomycetaceae bacterium]|nr:signal transduction histidine kinase, nitrogen specific, NtrB [Planctomycetaceae bacterium]